MALKPENARVGFVGLGIMGCNMAGHLLAAGCSLQVYNRSPGKAEPLLGAGATWQDSPAAVAAQSDAVITMLGDPADVEAVYFGGTGLIEAAHPGAYLIDMTTSEPALAARIADAAAARGVCALDAPVTGGDLGAREAKLSIMVGGSEEDFAAILPLLTVMGERIVLHGPAGSGQRAKLCNQILVAGIMLGMSEGLAYASKSGLDLAKVLESVASGAAASALLHRLGPRVLAEDFAPGFYIRHFIKDMELALVDAEARGLELPALSVALQQYRKLAGEGWSEKGTQALVKAYSG